MRLIFLLLLVSLTSVAQHSSQPEKESTNDLRARSMLFEIYEVSDKRVLWLEKTSNLDYLLKMKNNGDEKTIKISTRDGKKLDTEFASKFLKCQYELPKSESNCDVTLRLNLKGERQDICVKDDKKTQEIASFVKELTQRF